MVVGLTLRLASHVLRRQYCYMDNSDRAVGGPTAPGSRGAGSGVGVLDKAALVLAALEAGPATLAGLVAGTGLARPTAHRLAVALEHHRLVARDMQGRFVLGPRLSELSAAAGEDRLLATAGPVLARLRDITGESAQLWRRQGEHRVCVAAAERPTGLRDTIPVGSQLTMRAGSAAQVLLAWEDPRPDAPRTAECGVLRHRPVRDPTPGLGPVHRRAGARCRFGFGPGTLPLRESDRGGLGIRPARAALSPTRSDARPGRTGRGRPALRVPAAGGGRRVSLTSPVRAVQG